MVLNHGNINRKSRILKYFYFDEFPQSDLTDYINNDYQIILDSIPGIDKYRSIKPDLHDSIMGMTQIQNDIYLKLQLFTQENETYYKSIKFINSKIVSVNKVLKSGKISRINTKYHSYEFLYDEIYKENDSYYISIVFTTKPKIKSGIYYPFITIQFKGLDVI